MPAIVFELVSPEHFSLKFKNYLNQKIIAQLKTMLRQDVAKWIPEQKHWHLSLKIYDQLFMYIIKEVKGSGDEDSPIKKSSAYNSGGGQSNGSMVRQFDSKDVKIESIPDFVFNLTKIKVPFSSNLSFDRYLSKFKYEDDEKLGFNMMRIPETLRTKLFPFQRYGVEFGVNHFGRFLLGDEMGVGKTIQALAVASVYADDWPMVIICPKSLKLTWKYEIIKWLP
jgi:SNF2 family DNA or RNA helicase